MAEPARDKLMSALKNLLISGDHSDFVVTCGSDTHHVHKAIICARSGFFKRASRFPGQEAAESKVDLPEDDEVIVKLLIQYLYEAEYEPKLADSRKAVVPYAPAETTPVVRVNKQRGFNYDFPHTCSEICDSPHICPHHQCGRNGCDEGCFRFVCRACCPTWDLPAPPPRAEAAEAALLLLNAKMYEIGDKYDVDGLKELAREKFAWMCTLFWNSAYFAPAAYYAYSTTPDEDKGLREVVSKTLFDHMDLIKKPEVEAVLNEFNSLAVGLLMMRMKADQMMRPA